MATGSGAFSAKAGHNQSGGAHYIIVSGLVPSQVYQFPTATGSGGGYSQALPVSEYFSATAEWGTAYAGTAGMGALLATGCVIRDMGKTVQVPVNSVGAAAGPYVGMRTFRKFQTVLNTAVGEASFGVGGNAPVSTGGTTQTQTSSTTGYYTFYLEMPREAQDASTNVGGVTVTGTSSSLSGTTYTLTLSGYAGPTLPVGTTLFSTSVVGTGAYISVATNSTSYTVTFATGSPSLSSATITLGSRPQIARYM
jgi:hypothetical protein